jgi:hypothetical protein
MLVELYAPGYHTKKKYYYPTMVRITYNKNDPGFSFNLAIHKQYPNNNQIFIMETN